MIEFKPLTAEMVMTLTDLEPIHGGYALTADMAVDLEQIGGTAAVADGHVVAIAGILPRWDGVGMAWAWLGRSWRKYARAITNEVIRCLDASPFHRIEMGVKADYGRGLSWATRLGFEVETPLARKWGPDMADYTLFVRIK